MIEGLKDRDTQRWKSYAYLVIGIFILVIIILLIQSSINRKNTQNVETQANNIVVPIIVRANPKEVVEEFPETLVLNSKVEIIGSYSATYPDSSAKQTTVEFISSKNPEVNFDFYTKWAEDNEWQIINSSQSDLISSLYLKKAIEAINITIRSSAKTTGKSEIVINHVDLNQ
ncbi:MAG: hypothetical protein Q7R89_02030 [bacterium]|nr:hypothetical protein [bacterium]